MSDLVSLENHAALRPLLAQALAAGGEVIAAGAVLDISSQLDWTDTGLEVSHGQQVSVLASGVTWLAKAIGLGLEARLAIWYRIAGGPIAKVIDNTATFTADRAGRLELINGFTGQWLDESGRFDPAYPRTPAEGGFTVAVICWRGSASDGLARLAQADATGLAAQERARLAAEQPVPRGWTPMWRLGRTPIYCDAADADGAPHIACRCTRDAGILVHPADAPLDDSTRLTWRWRVSTLPSSVAEDTLPTHDYLSIAVEFDNGQDLTYMWSASLPVEHVFRCPLPWWDTRETHLVVRSGAADLGRWLDEERSILDDYRRAIGGEAPHRVVAVWLIAASVFQRHSGACDYSAIALSGRHGRVTICA